MVKVMAIYSPKSKNTYSNKQSLPLEAVIEVGGTTSSYLHGVKKAVLLVSLLNQGLYLGCMQLSILQNHQLISASKNTIHYCKQISITRAIHKG